MGRFISTATLRELAKQGDIVLGQDCILSPSAKDLIKELGVTVTYGNQVLSPSGKKVITVSQSMLFDTSSIKKDVVVDPSQTEFKSDLKMNGEEDLKNKVRRIIAETLKPACQNPKPKHIRSENAILQPFDQAPLGQKVGLIDVITAREANLGAGFMTFEHSELPWYLDYDEVDYVIEGDFVLKVGDQIFRAKSGDVVSIPKGSQVIFSSPTYCKVFYVTYPANWAE